MSERAVVMEIEDPHFTLKLYDDLLTIDLKGNFKNEVEEALENKPVLKETIGKMLGLFVPLHIRLSDIDSVHLNENGKIILSLSHHRNVALPLEQKGDAQKLVEKIDELSSKALDLKIKKDIEKRRAEIRLKRKSKGVSPSSYGTTPYYFPTEQTDIVDRLKRKSRKQKS